MPRKIAKYKARVLSPIPTFNFVTFPNACKDDSSLLTALFFYSLIPTVSKICAEAKSPLTGLPVQCVSLPPFNHNSDISAWNHPVMVSGHMRSVLHAISQSC